MYWICCCCCCDLGTNREREEERGQGEDGMRERERERACLRLVGEERGRWERGRERDIGRGESVRGWGCFGNSWSTMREGQWQPQLWLGSELDDGGCGAFFSHLCHAIHAMRS